MKSQLLLKYLRKCIDEYHLIDEGDRIAIGISGGKDSMVLAKGLSMLQRFYPKRFELIGITVDPRFGSDFSPAAAFLASLGIPYFVEETSIKEIVFDMRQEDHPCALCSNMRRAALTAAAEREGCTKLALAHHRDDYLSTLMLSLMYEGQFYTFAPKTVYEDRSITIIRPMLYVPEAAVKNYVAENSIPVVKNPCPADKHTKRAEMSELIEELKLRYPDIKDRLLHAVESSDIPDWKKLRE